MKRAYRCFRETTMKNGLGVMTTGPLPASGGWGILQR